MAGLTGGIVGEGALGPLVVGGVDRQRSVGPPIGVDAYTRDEHRLVVLVAARAEVGRDKVLSGHRAHARVDDVVVGAKRQRHPLPEPGGGRHLGGAEDAQPSANPSGGREVDRLDLVADVAVYAVVVGQSGRLQQSTPADLSVDARGVAVGAVADFCSDVVAGGRLAAVVVQQRQHTIAEVAAIGSGGGPWPDAGPPLPASSLTGAGI